MSVVVHSFHPRMGTPLKHRQPPAPCPTARASVTNLIQPTSPCICPPCLQVHAYEVFAPYPRPILDAALRQWHYASGAAGYLTPDDFLRFVSGAEERGSRRDAQRFWFGVLDGDGDGRIGRGDARAAYDAVAGSRAPGDTGAAGGCLRWSLGWFQDANMVDGWVGNWGCRAAGMFASAM